MAADVWLDWTGAKPNIDAAWAAAGLGGAPLSNAEYDTLRALVKTRMETHYSGFTVNFTESNPGGMFERLILGATTTSGGLFGQAERLDWRNRFKDDTANIYLANFSFVLSSGLYTRAQNFDRLAHAIAGTSSHELGHNLGLQHFDCYGQDNINAPGYGGISGQQNTAIMATGSTGLSAAGRGIARSFSPLEQLKLEFADDIAPSLGATVAEQGGAHGSTGTAQAVVGNLMPITGLGAINIDGRINVAGELDYYAFNATAGSLITGNIFSDLFENDDVDTIITLYNNSGVSLVSNDDISFSGNTFMSGGGYSNDSLILNYVATYTGTYYFRVTNFGTTTGNYEFLMSGMNPVPEPATLLVLGAGLALAVRKRRAKAA